MVSLEHTFFYQEFQTLDKFEDLEEHMFIEQVHCVILNRENRLLLVVKKFQGLSNLVILGSICSLASLSSFGR